MRWIPSHASGLSQRNCAAFLCWRQLPLTHPGAGGVWVWDSQERGRVRIGEGGGLKQDWESGENWAEDSLNKPFCISGITWVFLFFYD